MKFLKCLKVMNLKIFLMLFFQNLADIGHRLVVLNFLHISISVKCVAKHKFSTIFEDVSKF